MKYGKKLLALVLAAVSSLAVLTGCGEKTGPVKETSGETARVTDAEETVKTEETTDHRSGTPGVSRITERYFPVYENADEYGAMREKLEKWITDTFLNGTKAPFSFKYNSLPSAFVLQSWKRDTSCENTADGKKYTVSYTNPADGMRVWSEFTLFSDYPTVEWVTYAENGGSGFSGTISGFMGMDVSFPLDSENLTLHTTKGSLDIGVNDVHDFELVSEDLTTGAKTFTPELNDGRSSEHAWPFFDIVGKNSGLMVGIGWTGNWKAIFNANGTKAMMTAGMNNFSSYLKPGEKIRTPLYSITYFDGDAEYGHNLFRRTVLAHYTPKDGTKDVCKLPISVTTESFGENEIIADVSKWLGKLSVDTVWTDAAWFGNTDRNSWTVETGNWWINQVRYPSGSLKKVSDFLHTNGKKYVVWFEIERVAEKTQLAVEHPDLMMRAGVAGSRILNLASEAGYQWAENYLLTTIRENGIDVFRQDFNSPGIALAWAAQDEEGRAGMTELRYVENLYRLYDKLHEQFPGIMLDDCASGGKRIDLEMLKRMVVLHRSDYTCVQYGTGEGQFNAEGIQYQCQNLSYWLPLHGSSIGWPVRIFDDPYLARSLYSPGVGLGIQLGYAADDANAQKLTKEMSDFRGYFIGDYYSLLEPKYDRTSMQAYMYVRTDLNEALVLAYHRPESLGKTKQTIVMKGLDPGTRYCVSDPDAKEGQEKYYTGAELMKTGYPLTIAVGKAKVLVLTPAGN